MMGRPKLGASLNRTLRGMKVLYTRSLKYLRTSAATWLDRSDPPMLLLHGDADTIVPYVQAQRFVEALRAAGVEAELYTEKGAGHTWYSQMPYFTPTAETLARFLDLHFK